MNINIGKEKNKKKQGNTSNHETGNELKSSLFQPYINKTVMIIFITWNMLIDTALSDYLLWQLYGILKKKFLFLV